MPNFGFLSTYPPTQNGLATFASALLHSLTADGSEDRAGVVRVVDTAVRSRAPEVVAHLHTRATGAHHAAAEALNTFDVAIVAHDYGIYGGPDGDQVLAILDEVRVPAITVVHTVEANPTPHQRQVLENVVAASTAVVTLSSSAHHRLIDEYSVNPAKLTVIPPGAVPFDEDDQPLPGGRPLILTWGFLGPGKGIECAIDAMRVIRNLRPRPAYIVAGQTDQRTHQHQGEAYRLHLNRRARAAGVADLVRFASSYLEPAALTRLIRRADMVLIPYDSRDQASSGVLVEALAAGKPVIATAFPHAVELLSGGAGLLVPQYDANAMGAALQRVLTEPDLVASLSAEAVRLAPTFAWPTVAASYRQLAHAALNSRTPALS